MARDAPNDRLRAFGAAVRDLRTSRGLSQERLADEIGLHRTYLGDVERGHRNVGLLNLWRIAQALDAAPSELVARAEALVPGPSNEQSS